MSEKQNTKRNAFVTGSTQSLEPIIPLISSVLGDYNIECRTFRNIALSAGVRWTDILKEAIANSSLFIAVVDDEPNQNTLFELGLATAFDIPVLIVGDASGFGFSDLNRIPQLRVPLKDSHALKFQLDMALSNLDLLKRQVAPSSAAPSERKSRISTRIHSKNPSNELEKHISRALDYAPEVQSFVYEPQLESGNALFQPDFAAWIDYQDVLFSGPLIIEVKQRLRKLDRQTINEVAAYVGSLENAAGIIVAETADSFAFEIHSISPLVYITQVGEFVSLLGKGNLLETMRSERNKMAHQY